MGAIVLYNDTAKRRFELAKLPEVAKALDTAERVIYKAQFQRPVSSYKMPELLAELPDIIRDAAMQVGCRIAPNDMTIAAKMAANVLTRYYSGLTLSDFGTAFEMCALGELDRFLPKRDGQPDRGHYQMFNTEYIGKVLRAYSLRRAEVMRKAEGARPAAEPARDMEQEARDWQVVRDGFLHDWLYYKYHGRMPRISPVAVVIYYNTLARLGWCEEMEVTPREQDAVIYGAMAGLAGKGSRENERTARKRQEIERAFRDMVEDEIQFGKFI